MSLFDAREDLPYLISAAQAINEISRVIAAVAAGQELAPR